MGLSHRMCSQEPVITLFLISRFTPLFTTIWRGCQGLAWWQNQTHGLRALPGSRGKSWREKAFLQFTLVCPASSLCGVGRQPALLTQAALPLNKTTSSSSGIQKHARKNKSPDRGLVTGRREASLQGILKSSCTPDQCSYIGIFAFYILCCAGLI